MARREPDPIALDAGSGLKKNVQRSPVAPELDTDLGQYPIGLIFDSRKGGGGQQLVGRNFPPNECRRFRARGVAAQAAAARLAAPRLVHAGVGYFQCNRSVANSHRLNSQNCCRPNIEIFSLWHQNFCEPLECRQRVGLACRSEFVSRTTEPVAPDQGDGGTSIADPADSQFSL